MKRSNLTSSEHVLYIDAHAGIAGDMFLSGLIHVGADLDAINHAIKKVIGSEYNIKTIEIEYNGIHGLGIDVSALSSNGERSVKEIKDMIKAGSLEAEVEDIAIRILDKIALAESKVHGVEPDHVHLHEIGAVDTIIDIVGISAGVISLGIKKIFCSPLPLTRGYCQTRHGKMPLPAPATLEILKGFPIYWEDVNGEFVTPTGAAVCAVLSEGKSHPPPMRIKGIGYGFGVYRWPDGRPNCVRLIFGYLEKQNFDIEWEVSANIDDMSPEEIAVLAEEIFASGALDVWVTPIIMKKGRPGFIISAIVGQNSKEKVVLTMFRNSSTLGVRIHQIEREKLAYSIETVNTSMGIVRIKRPLHIRSKDEFSIENDDIKKICASTNRPFREIKEKLRKELSLTKVEP